MQKKPRKWLPSVAFVAAAITATVLSTAMPANAWWNRNSPLACTKGSGNGTLAVSGDGHVYNSNVTDNNILGAYCPTQDTSAMPKTAVLTRNVHGYDGNNDSDSSGSVLAYLCVSYWDVNGSDCGSADTTSQTGTGQYTLSPGLGSWASSGDFGFLFVSLPNYDVNYSYLRGWYHTN